MELDLRKPLDKSKAILVTVLVLLIAFGIALIASHSGNIPLKSAIRLNTTNTGDVQTGGEYIYYLEAGSLHCVSSRGKFEWNVGVDSGSHFRVSSKGIAVWSGQRLRLINRNTGAPMGSYTASTDILSAVVGDKYAAAVLGPEHNSTIVLMDLDGNVRDTVDNLSDLTVIDCGFFDGRDLCWVMCLDSTGTLPTCRISTYKPGKRETGAITDMEQVFYKVMFRSSYICAVGTNFMKVYDYTGQEKEDERLTVYGWYLEAVDSIQSDDPLMLFVPNRQSGEVIEMQDIRCIKNGEEYMMHLPEKCDRLMCRGNTIYGFNKNHLIVGTYGSPMQNLYELPMMVDEVIGITEDNVAVVTSGSFIYMITLPYV